MPDTFSQRHGFASSDAEILIRNDAPQEVRVAVATGARDLGLQPSAIRETVCDFLFKRPDPSNWSEYPNVWWEVQEILDDCQWYKVYDIAEVLSKQLDPNGLSKEYAEILNRCFYEYGIGWEMQNGEILYRGDTGSDTIQKALQDLEATGRKSAASELREARKDISRRPSPDTTGAIQHSIAALEAVARDIQNEPNNTLGQLIPRLNIPQPIDKAAEKIWGFASNYARHVQEGQVVRLVEAELVVSFSSALCSYLTSISQQIQNKNPAK